MSDNDKNIRKTEDFIRDVLKRTFGQEVDQESLSSAAERLRKALPDVDDAKAA